MSVYSSWFHFSCIHVHVNVHVIVVPWASGVYGFCFWVLNCPKDTNYLYTHRSPRLTCTMMHSNCHLWHQIQSTATCMTRKPGLPWYLIHLSQLHLEAVTGTVLEQYGCHGSHVPWLPRVYGYCTLWRRLWSFVHHDTSMYIQVDTYIVAHNLTYLQVNLM